MVAATALEHGMTVVTRNVADFAGTGVHSLGRAMDAKPIAQINTRGKFPVIICACTRARLTNPLVANPPVFRAAVQSNKVYPPRLSARALAGIAARRGGSTLFVGRREKRFNRSL